MGRPRSALAELCRLQITKHGLVGVLGAIAANKNDYAARTKIPITVSDQINAIRLLLLYVAVVPVNVSPALMDFMATPIELFVRQPLAYGMSVGIGDEVYMPGLFTYATGSRRNIPLVRYGNLAMIPDEPIQIDAGFAEALLRPIW
jgi:hypothetical protein